MNQQQVPKKNWGMIILILILIPILALGFMYGYKTLMGSNTNNLNPSTNNNNAGFQLTGVWYLNTPGTNSKYIFDAPNNVNGKMQGMVDMVFDNQSDGKVNYEVLREGKLRITDPQGYFNPWELDYTFNSSAQTLEIKANGNNSLYTRNPPAGNPNNQNNNNATNTQTQSAGNPSRVVFGNQTPQNSNTSTINNKSTAVNNVASVWKVSYNDGNGMVYITRTFYDLVIQNGNLVGGKYMRVLQADGFSGEEKVYYSFTMNGQDEYDWEVFNIVGNGQFAGSGKLSIGSKGTSKLLLMADGTMVIHDKGTTPGNQHMYKRIK